MSIMGLDHVAIAVHSLDEAVPRYTKLLETSPRYHTVEEQGVRLAVFALESGRVELLEPLDESSSLARFLEDRGEGIHHLALGTDQIERELHRLRGEGFDVLDDSPRPGAEGYAIGFLHPRDCHGALVECAQPPSNSDDDLPDG